MGQGGRGLAQNSHVSYSTNTSSQNAISIINMMKAMVEPNKDPLVKIALEKLERTNIPLQ